MYCRKCGVDMKEERRSFHKQRKWICPKCGKLKMQPVSKCKNKDKGNWHEQ